jgi:hypothetical protein
MYQTRTIDRRVARARAIGFDASPLYGADPRYRDMRIEWVSAFDRDCYIVSKSGSDAAGTRRRRGYVRTLVEQTGFTEDEVLAHGRHVRAVLADLYRTSRSARAERARVRVPPVPIEI